MAQTVQTKEHSFNPEWRFQEKVSWRDTDLDENVLTEWFHYILLGRQIDYRFQVLNRQGRAPFIISCAGHEAAQIGVGPAIRNPEFPDANGRLSSTFSTRDRSDSRRIECGSSNYKRPLHSGAPCGVPPLPRSQE